MRLSDFCQTCSDVPQNCAGLSHLSHFLKLVADSFYVSDSSPNCSDFSRLLICFRYPPDNSMFFAPPPYFSDLPNLCRMCFRPLSDFSEFPDLCQMFQIFWEFHQTDLLVLFQTFQTVVRLRTSLADLCPHVYTFSHVCPSFQPFLLSVGHFHTFARLLADFSDIFKLLQVLVHDLVRLLEPQTFVYFFRNVADIPYMFNHLHTIAYIAHLCIHFRSLSGLFKRLCSSPDICIHSETI